MSNRVTKVVQLPTITESNTASVTMVEVPDVGVQGKMDIYAKVTKNGTQTSTLVAKGCFVTAPEANDLFAITQATTNPGTGTATVLLADGQPNKYTHLQLTLTPTANNDPGDWITAKVYIVTY